MAKLTILNVTDWARFVEATNAKLRKNFKAFEIETKDIKDMVSRKQQSYIFGCVYPRLKQALLAAGYEIKSRYDICYISNRYYDITITPWHIKIGCQYHAQEAWWNFTDEQIEKIDGDNALSFWKIWKEPLKQICDAMKKEKGEKNVE